MEKKSFRHYMAVAGQILGLTFALILFVTVVRGIFVLSSLLFWDSTAAIFTLFVVIVCFIWARTDP